MYDKMNKTHFAVETSKKHDFKKIFLSQLE